MTEEKTTEKETQTETESATVDANKTNDENQAAAAGDTTDKEEAQVPSHRLREETEKRKLETQRADKAEADLVALQANQTQQAPQTGQQLTQEQIDAAFQRDVETYGWGTSVAKWGREGAIQAQKQQMEPMQRQMGDAFVVMHVQALKSTFPDIEKYTAKIQKELAPQSFDIKSNQESVKHIYLKLKGEEAVSPEYVKKIQDEAIEKAKKNKEIIGEHSIPGGTGASGGDSGLTKAQETERVKMGQTKEAYTKLLKHVQDIDKKAKKEPRQTVNKQYDEVF